MVTVMRVLTEVPRDKGSAIVRFPCDGPGLQVLIYGDSLTAGAPSMKPFGEEFSKSLAEFGCRVEVIACGLCAATAHEMIQVFEEPFVLDSLQCRWGSGLGHLAKEADVVLIMAGTNDLCFADGKQIFDATRGLHAACHSLGVPTVALGIPDSGGRCLKRWSALPAQRREANSLLASWTRGSVDISVDVTCPRRPLRFINTVALMPFGPQSRLKKYWESDGVHFTETGSKVFGFRLAQLLVAS
ncbi:Pregnancy-associated glycoprotein 2 (Fragment) [Durusdinium trenchii]|uniref:Pregnancy-associated glycoprotein 2 n=1 Tax=Durusdinium trenchii TaxID=1381693 RepID=A0ABP0J1Y1_9DINO